MPHPLEHDGDEPPSENNNGGQAYIEDKDAQIFALRDAFRHVKIVHRDHSNDQWCQCPVCQVFKTQVPKVVPWDLVSQLLELTFRGIPKLIDSRDADEYEKLLKKIQAYEPKGTIKDAS